MHALFFLGCIHDLRNVDAPIVPVQGPERDAPRDSGLDNFTLMKILISISMAWRLCVRCHGYMIISLGSKKFSSEARIFRSYSFSGIHIDTSFLSVI